MRRPPAAPVRIRASRLPRTTAVGRRATLIGLGLLLAGFNTGNNLFHLLFAVLAAAEVVGFFASRRALAQARVVARLAPRGEVGAPLAVEIEVTNGARRAVLPALAWTVRGDGAEPSVVSTPALGPGATGTGRGTLVPARRGTLHLDAAETRTDYPLGLAAVRARAELSAASTLVRPRPEAGAAATRPSPADAASAHAVSDLGRGGEEPVEPRPYLPGDDAREIDWKATARAGRVIARRRRGEPRDQVDVTLALGGPPGPAFERRVSRAAGAALHALSAGAAVGLVTEEASVPRGAGPAQAGRILDFLARVTPSSAPSVRDTPGGRGTG